MVYIILKIIGLFSGLGHFWNDAISQISIPLLIFSYLIDVYAFCYSFMAIYRALQRKPYSITMLKISVLYVFFQSLFLLFHRLNGVLHRTAYIYALIPLFFLVFFVYLWRSKQLKKYIPKADRKFGLMGTLGVLIYLLVFIRPIITYVDPIIKSKNSLPVPVTEVSLQNGELTDGLAAYRPHKDWVNDTIVGNEEDGISRIFHSEKCFHILLSTVKYNCKNKIDYYKVLSECCRSQIPDSIALEEVYNKDSLVGENRFYINSYRLKHNTDSTKYYWTFSALVDNSSYKIVTLACSEKDTLNASINYSKQFMESVRFDLKE